MDLNDAQLETVERIRANSGSPAGEHEASEHDEGALIVFDNGSGYVLDADGAIIGFADEERDSADIADEDETESEEETEETESEADAEAEAETEKLEPEAEIEEE